MIRGGMGGSVRFLDGSFPTARVPGAPPMLKGGATPSAAGPLPFGTFLDFDETNGDKRGQRPTGTFLDFDAVRNLGDLPLP